MAHLLQTEWIGYRDSVYEGLEIEDDAFAFDAGDVERAFFAGALALFNLLGDHALTDPDETVTSVKAELLAFAADIKKQAEGA